MSRLTGRTRYRETWLRRLVLQVEVSTTRYSRIEECDLVLTSWRDALPDDFTTPVVRARFGKAPLPYPGQRPVTDNQ